MFTLVNIYTYIIFYSKITYNTVLYMFYYFYSFLLHDILLQRDVIDIKKIVWVSSEQIIDSVNLQYDIN